MCLNCEKNRKQLLKNNVFISWGWYLAWLSNQSPVFTVETNTGM